jgi:hypothetical protein
MGVNLSAHFDSITRGYTYSHTIAPQIGPTALTPSNFIAAIHKPTSGTRNIHCTNTSLRSQTM